MGKPYQHLEITEKTLDELRESINYLKAQNNPQWRLLLTQLDYLFSNLATVERQLANISNPDATVKAHSIPDLWRRITSQLNPQSLLFRHALRMAIALTVGRTRVLDFADHPLCLSA